MPSIIVIVISQTLFGAEGDLVDLENARRGYAQEKAKIEEDLQASLAALKQKHKKVAEQGKAAAVKKGDLKLALAWEEMVEDLLSLEGKQRSTTLKEVEDARAEYAGEAMELSVDRKKKLKAVLEKHLRGAERGKVAATKGGDLKLALAWEEFSGELKPKLVNLAPRSKVDTSADLPEHPRQHMVDGDLTTEVNAHRYWYAARNSGSHRATFKLPGASVVHKVRLLTPVATKWHRTGHEPLDYDVALRLEGKVRERISVRGGKHPRLEPGANKKSQWIEVDFKSDVPVSEVEFTCSRTSGRNLAPAVFECEILGEE